jgi:L-malate glycosyltransferase
MRVLFVNHTAQVSGAERSLLDLVRDLDGRVEPHLACPEGDLLDRARALEVPTHRITGTDGSLRLHPLRTPQSLAEIARSRAEIRRLAAGCDADIVHANSVRAGLMAVAWGRRRPRVVVHLRDCLPRSRTAGCVRRVIDRGADAVIANSEHTAASFRVPGPRARLVALHDFLDLEAYRPGRTDATAARRRLGAQPEATLIGVVAQITPWKGQDDAIRIVHLLRDRWPGLHLLIIGSAKFASAATRFRNDEYLMALHRMVETLGLAGRVRFLGEREDVPELLAALDAVLVPSWEEPFGRVVVEAMAMGLPVLATRVGGPAELVTDGRDGLLLTPRDPRSWADALDRLLSSPGALAAMGRRARHTAVTRFSLAAHAERLLEVYGETLAGRRPPAG